MKWRWIAGSCLAVAVVVYAAFQASPWPAVWLIRFGFEQGTRSQKHGLQKYLPDDVAALHDERYGGGSDERLDAFFPKTIEKTTRTLPTIVWVHGGAFVYGDKSNVEEYLKILAAKGYTTVGVDYSIAPGAKYPTPVKQVNQALAFLLRNADRFHVDTSNIFLAGDSAGSQIAAQVAALTADAGYAEKVGIRPALSPAQLRGAILFCGIYDAAHLKFDGRFGWMLRAVVWSYFGKKHWAGDPRLEEFDILQHVTPQFPPAFVSVGNADPLQGQSNLLAAELRNKGVAVDTLFFPTDYHPSLPHEYQFTLDNEAGQRALQRVTEFLARRIT